MFTIVGSGFGLYGYLPAIVEGLGEKVILPRRYERKVHERPELTHVFEDICWVESEDVAFELATAAIIATPPLRQGHVLTRLLTMPNIEMFVLEKPVAETPSLARDLLARVDKANKRYHIGYTFLYTSWFDRLIWPSSSVPNCALSINWTFLAHHFRTQIDTWKSAHHAGGGVLRFYGIHLIALLARYGYQDVYTSSLEGAKANEPERWNAVFFGPGLPDCSVHVDSRNPTSSFTISQDIAGMKMPLLELSEPFAEETSIAGADARVSVLTRFLTQLRTDNSHDPEYCDRVNCLWLSVERASAA